ncbi:TetR/AcrR family transcriptional regulator [Corynebacterium mastitidis]|uniref:TetR/AcrR family transcriptional regulator n=1 Tax=Corynebacterium mastitidis TaxID=161890 RepID=UPI000375F1DD|nr:TetR/AcrR family transcriptional regulator [Corynebacterium mastitidis]
MTTDAAPTGRRERAKEEKRRRIVAAAQRLFAEEDVDCVTAQRLAREAEVATGTLYLYAATKAELLIMAKNDKFASAICEGAAAVAAAVSDEGPVQRVMLLLEPVVRCIREQPHNGRAYMNELLYGNPQEPHRARGLELSFALEESVAGVLVDSAGLDAPRAATLARVVTAIMQLTTTATLHAEDTVAEILDTIRTQLHAVLSAR